MRLAAAPGSQQTLAKLLPKWSWCSPETLEKVTGEGWETGMFPISRKEISDDTSNTSLWFLSPLGFRLLPRSFPPTHYSLLWTAPMAGTSTSHLLPDPLWNREGTETTIGKEVPSFTDFHAMSCLMSSPVRSFHPKTRDASLLHVSFFILLPFLPGPPSLGVL